MQSRLSITVIGGGASGLSCGVRLREAGFPVHLYTREDPRETTSGVAGAIWHPLSSIGHPRQEEWALATGRAFGQLADLPDSGVQRIPLLEPMAGPEFEPDWVKVLTNLRLARLDDLPPGYIHGIWYDTYLIETPLYLPFLMDRFQALGGTVSIQEVTELDALTAADRIVVNCSGVWAGQLADDPRVYPIQGQVIRLRPQPGWRHGIHVDGGRLGFSYIFPRSQDCILGGTQVPHVWSRQPDEAVSADIRRRCAVLRGDAALAEALDVRVGLRPGRDEVRLAVEQRPRGPVIHNYGHGGIGYTLSWGCADEVTRLALGVEGTNFP